MKPGTAGTLTFAIDHSDSLMLADYDNFVKPWNDSRLNAKVELLAEPNVGDSAKYEQFTILAAGGTPVDGAGFKDSASAQSPDPVRAIAGHVQFEKTIATPLWSNLLAQKVTVPDGLAQAQTQLQALLDQSKK